MHFPESRSPQEEFDDDFDSESEVSRTQELKDWFWESFEYAETVDGSEILHNHLFGCIKPL